MNARRYRSADPASLFYVPPDLLAAYDAELRPAPDVLASVDVSDDDISAAWFGELAPSAGRMLDPWNYSRMAEKLREHRAVLAVVRDRPAAVAVAASSSAGRAGWWRPS